MLLGANYSTGAVFHATAAVDIMTSQLIFSLYYRSLLPQMRNGSAKVCEVYCGYG